MELFLITWPGPYWWLGGVALGAILALLVVAEKHPWQQGFRAYLAISRFLVGLGIVLTLGQPVLRTFVNEEIKPLIGLAFDDSKSVGTFTQALKTPVSAQLKALKATLETGGYSVAVYRAGGDTALDNKVCAAPRSDLQTLLYLARQARGNAQLTATVLVSDGLFNEGTNPALLPPRIPTYTIGVGDTTRRPDARIAAFRVNKLVAAGANYIATAEVQAQGLSLQRLSLSIEQDGITVASRLLSLGGASRRARVQFVLPAGAEGTRTLKVSLQPAKTERQLRNNTTLAYVQVARLAKRVLLAAAAPHPDIKALVAALQPLDQLEVVPFINGISAPVQGRFDVVICHGLPSREAVLPPALEQLTRRVPCFYVVTSLTDLGQLAAQCAVLTIQNPVGQDDVSGALNPGFSRFVTEQLRADILPSLPPLQVPFGTYIASPRSQTLLWQWVGRVPNGKPLWVVGTGSGSEASAVLAGEGLWQWRLKEAYDEGKPTVVDYLVQRTILLLAAQAERKRFRFQPLAPVVNVGTAVGFEAYLEDRAGQPIVSKTIDVELKGPGGFSKRVALTSSDGATGLELAQLPEGIYTYKAFTRLAGEQLVDQGRLAVQPADLEDISTGADFALLKNLSKATGATFTTLPGIDALAKTLIARRPANVLRTRETSAPLAKQWWWLSLLLGLVLAEVAARKLKGGL